jgi:hypothetical protein
MRLLVLLIYAVVGFILWRAVRLALRMISGSPKETDGRVRGRPEQPVQDKEPFTRGQIKEAEFEDLTPPRKDDQQSSPHQ